MQLSECFELGYVLKTHGLKGELLIVLDVDNPEEYEEMDSFYSGFGTISALFFRFV